jgi:enoyl-CoA hydratase/carnithine racemase
MRSQKTVHFELETRDRVLVVTIANPPHNFLRSGFFQELYEHRERLESPDVDAVVITGQGQVFSKGVDLSELQSHLGMLDAEAVLYGNQVFTYISKLRKPVIAAINGPCLGGGLELALACHIRVCSDRARLGLPELSVGVIPGLGGIARLVRVVGEAKAIELILLGDLIPAPRAMEINLVSRVFPRKDFLEKALLFTKAITSTRSECIREVLDLVVQSRAMGEDEAVQRAAEAFARIVSSMRPRPSRSAAVAGMHAKV